MIILYSLESVLRTGRGNMAVSNGEAIGQDVISNALVI